MELVRDSAFTYSSQGGAFHSAWTLKEFAVPMWKNTNGFISEPNLLEAVEMAGHNPPAAENCNFQVGRDQEVCTRRNLPQVQDNHSVEDIPTRHKMIKLNVCGSVKTR